VIFLFFCSSLAISCLFFCRTALHHLCHLLSFCLSFIFSSLDHSSNLIFSLDFFLISGSKTPAKKAAAAPKKAPASKSKTAAKNNALKAAKQVKKGAGAAVKESRKVRTTVHFYRPKTLKLARNPKYQRKALPGRNKLDKFAVLKYPVCSDTAMKQIEDNNTLTFIVDLKASKRHIAEAVNKLYDIKAVKINTLIRPDGLKKAYVRLSADTEALDVANTIGII
jgi:large subunit ribosomal protein L23Ae